MEPFKKVITKGRADWIDLPQKKLSAIDLMNYIILQVLPGTLSIKLIRFTEDEMWGKMPYRHETCNPAGIMHGGTIFSFGDTVAGCLLWANDLVSVSSSAEIKYLRPVQKGSLTCYAKKILHNVDNVRVVANVYDEEQKRIARMKINYAIIP